MRVTPYKHGWVIVRKSNRSKLSESIKYGYSSGCPWSQASSIQGTRNKIERAGGNCVVAETGRVSGAIWRPGYPGSVWKSADKPALNPHRRNCHLGARDRRQTFLRWLSIYGSSKAFGVTGGFLAL